MTIAEMYKSMTGVDMPKPFVERTNEERLAAQDRFFKTVNESDDDEAIDELFKNVTMNLQFQTLHLETMKTSVQHDPVPL